MLLYASLDISTDLFVIFLLGNYLPRSEEGSDVTVAAGGNLSTQQRELLEKLIFDVLPALLTAAKLRLASSC